MSQGFFLFFYQQQSVLNQVPRERCIFNVFPIIVGVAIFDSNTLHALTQRVHNVHQSNCPSACLTCTYHINFEDLCKSSQINPKMSFQIIQSQPAEKQANMATWFQNLMEGIDQNLLTKNRDR